MEAVTTNIKTLSTTMSSSFGSCGRIRKKPDNANDWFQQTGRNNCPLLRTEILMFSVRVNSPDLTCHLDRVKKIAMNYFALRMHLM